MAISLGSLVVDLVAKTSNFVEGMSAAKREAQQAAKSIQSNFAELGNAAQSLLAPFGEIGGAIGQSLGNIGQTMRSVSDSLSPLIGELGLVGAGFASVVGAAAALGAAGAGIALFAAKSGDELFALSQNSGVSAEALSSLAYASQQSGVNMDTLANGLQKLNRSAFAAATAPASAVNAYTRLGIAVKDATGNLRPTQDILLDVAGKFETMRDGVAKVALAQAIFGRSGASMITFLNSGKQSIAGLVQEANEFGVTMSGKTAAAANTFNDTLDRISGAMKGASNILLTAMLPSLQSLADFFVNEMKDPSSSFRELGSVIGEILVPSFKLLASVIVTAVTAADYFASVLGSGIQFATQQVLGLVNAFEDLKSGHFKEAGTELKSQFQSGLETFTKGVQDETAKADKRLTDFFAKTVFGADDQSALQKQGNLQDFNPDQKNKFTDNTETRITNIFRQIKPVIAPDLTQATQQFEQIGEELQKLNNISGTTDAVLAIGAESLDSFYSEFQRRNSDTIDAVNAKFDEMQAHFSGMLGLNAIDQQQFNQVSKDLETERLAEIERLRVKSGTDFVASFADAFNEIIANGDQMAAHFASSFSNALNGVNDQLAALVTTGKADFAQIGKQLSANFVKSGAEKLESTATKSIAGLFGVKFSGKPKGTSSDPIYTRSADSVASNPAAALGHLKLGGIGKDIGHDFGKVFSGIGSAFGKIGSFFGSLFGGFRAGGGDTMAGKAYVVGEQRPEIFVPDRPGRIVPSLAAAGAGGRQTVVQNTFHFHGVTDADSFKASKNQIMNHVANSVSRAVSRR